MRNTLILLLALLAGTAFAQAPVIDSMLIDESKGILSVYGDFGSAQGKVWCDSVELPVLSWGASLVTATIPDTGKGSAGGVVVEDIGGVSMGRLISSWEGSIYTKNFHGDSYLGTDDRYNLTYYVRLDLTTILNNQNQTATLSLGSLSTYSRYHYSGGHYLPEYGKEYIIMANDTVYIETDSVAYSRGFRCAPKLLLSDKQFVFYLDSIKGVIEARTGTFGPPDSAYTVIYNKPIHTYLFKASLDSEFRIVNFDTIISSYPYPISTRNSVFSRESFLPFKTISLTFTPSIIAPKDNQSNLGTNDILLQWNPLKYMDAYHIQLSKDSLINGQRAGQQQQGVAYIVDTIVSSLNFSPPPLEKNTKYYWRVCGVNTEGESRWSEVWSFTAGTSTDVKQEHAKSISLVCYPNPVMNELTIVTTEPTRLLLYDVTGKIVKSEQATSNLTKWDVSLLPNGTYILGTSSGEMQVVQIVK